MATLHLLLGIPVLFLGMAALAYAVLGVVKKRPYTRRMWDLAAWFSVSLFLQIITGFFLIFSTTNRSFDRSLGLHMILTMVAALLAQLSYSANRRRPRGDRDYRTHILGVGIALALVVAGVAVIH